MSSSHQLNALRVLLFVACALPLASLSWSGFQGQLGVNPIETLTHATGQWALRLLLVTLCMSPLARIMQASWPIQIRRQLGLWSFCYLMLHFLTFLVFDLSLDFALLSEEIIERPYITLGFSAFLLLLPLALTSTRGWQRRLKRNWKRLHKLIYPAVILACLHFLWKAKVLEAEPLIYALIAALLLLARQRKVQQWLHI